LLRDTFCAGERFCVIPVGVAEGRLNAVARTAKRRQTLRSTRRFLAVSNSWQSIAETDKGDSRTGELSLRRLTFEPSEGCGRLGNDSATTSEGGFKSRLVSAIGHVKNIVTSKALHAKLRESFPKVSWTKLGNNCGVE
jgi:hypothetical protein